MQATIGTIEGCIGDTYVGGDPAGHEASQDTFPRCGSRETPHEFTRG